MATAATTSVAGTALTYDAAPGEANHLTVDFASPSTYTLTDTGAPIAPRSGCEAVTGSQVRCTVRVTTRQIAISLGDGNDFVQLPASRHDQLGELLVHGGPGDDELDGGEFSENLAGEEGNDTIRGGGGNDVISGGTDYEAYSLGIFGERDPVTTNNLSGNDTLEGGPGDDTFWDGDFGAGGPDVIDGGPGLDLVTYLFRTVPVAVDLRQAGGQGANGESDTTRSVEDVTGGEGNDRLTGDNVANILDGGGYIEIDHGDEQPEELVHSSGHDALAGGGGNDDLAGRDGNDALAGGAGKDTLRGEAGNDRVDGGPGKDALLGGRGRDLLLARDGTRDRVSCGRNRDTARVDRHDRVNRDCERVTVR
jgi:Ca2+-binding RTX toxin-like protein